jgi:uncharacterized damage-inducible protein DinB
VTTRKHKVHTQLSQAAVHIFAANDRMNQILIERLDPAAWRAKPPGNVRPIAAIFTHMHNVRTKWIRLSAPHLKVPVKLSRTSATPEQTSAALNVSAARCADMLAEALGNSAGRIEVFRRDGWGQPWPAGPEMLCYMLAHEAHHRGQVCMLAHQLGCGTGKNCGKSAARLAAPAQIRRSLSKQKAPGCLGAPGLDSETRETTKATPPAQSVDEPIETAAPALELQTPNRPQSPSR